MGTLATELRRYIVTSELDLSAPFSVLISAKVWPKDTSGIKVTAGESAAITTADLTEEFKSYLLKFDAQNSKTKIRIEPSATNERIIIESIQIVSGHDVTLPPVLKITSETTLSNLVDFFVHESATAQTDRIHTSVSLAQR